ncbi:MAG: molybdenum cofactor biosynthesis protein MoaE [Desulfurococcales archaeon]|nr:molybdenum cofactor biosynthesis protein MoaE [Desulfurococcales archaeon]
MRIRVRLYAVLAELAGSSEIVIECNDRCSVNEVLDRLAEIGEGLSMVLSKLKGIIVLDEKGRRLGGNDVIEGERVDVLPPSAGGSKVYVRVARGSDEFSLDKLFGMLDSSDETGATLFFIGTVRKLNRGGIVSELYYDAHESLEAKLRDIASGVLEKYSLDSVALIHYTGTRKPGDITFIAIVRAGSRGPGFAALRELVEKVKHEAPIWKRETRDDGVYWIIGESDVKVK